MTTQSRSPWSTTLADSLRWQAAALSAGAAAVHFAVIPEHVQEWWLFGAFFFVVAWFQTASMIGLVVRAGRRLLLLVVAVNAIVILIWIWSRTAGLPIGPEAGEPEAIGAADVLSTVLEVLLEGWALALLSLRFSSKGASRGLGRLTTVIVWVAVVGATALVFFTATGEAMPH